MTATPKRLQRLRLILAEQRGPDSLDQTLQLIATTSPERQQDYLDALCDAWLGPIQRRGERSDKGTWHGPRMWYYLWECVVCGGEVVAARVDALYCSNACRQRAYRQRGGS